METTNSTNKPIIFGILAIILVGIAVFALYFVDVDQTKEARLPELDVDVNVKDGQLPKFDVDTGSISVGTKKVDIEVPTADVKTKIVEIEVPTDVEVGTKKVDIKLPTLNIEPPKQDDPADN